LISLKRIGIFNLIGRTMKPAIIKAAILFACSLLFALQAEAAVIIDDAVIRNSYNVEPRIDLFLLKSLDLQPRLLYVAIVPFSGDQFQFNDFGQPGNWALYPVEPGTVIDPAFAASTTPIVTNKLGTNSAMLTFAPGESKEFAFWDERTFDDPATPNAGDYYGWAQISRGVDGLHVTTSATATGDGIIAGTTTQTPEPSPAILIPLAGTLFLGLGRRTRRG
jgi:hypothetical protein